MSIETSFLILKTLFKRSLLNKNKVIFETSLYFLILIETDFKS